MPDHQYGFRQYHSTTEQVSIQCTDIHKIESGVSQGSVLGLVLYTLYTSDLPLSQQSYNATFADDTATMAVNKNPDIASSILQQSLNEIQEWMKNGELWPVKTSRHILHSL